jgi:hypothetical protein
MGTFHFSLPTPDLQSKYRRAHFLFEGVYYPERPYTANVFLDQPEADENTPTKGNPHFVGDFNMMSRKYIPGNEERGLLPWARPAFAGRTEPDQPATIAMDATEALEAFAKLSPCRSDSSLKVVLVDTIGRRLADDLLRFDGVKLEFE